VLSFVSPEASPDKMNQKSDGAQMNLSGRGMTDSRSKNTVSKTEAEDNRKNSASRYEYISVD
jgi:hypothetical protein